MVLLAETIVKILQYHQDGKKPPTIEKMLREEDIKASRTAIWKLLAQYKKNGTIARLEGAGRKKKLTPEVKTIIEDQMSKNDETTAYQLLKEQGFTVSLSSVLRYRKSLGWTYRGASVVS